MNSILVSVGKESKKLEETSQLAQTLGYEILEKFIQKKKPRTKWLVGKGKLEEIKKFIELNKIELVIFENLLTSAQALALEDFLKIPVIDRFDLILNVFEQHASSKEAKLQIELARLKRKIPYVKALLGRKVRKEHPGFGGSGEFIIRNTITGLRRRIRKIERKLDKFEKRTLVQTEKRKKLGKLVALAGYTNVGKTTLLNALTGLNQKVKDEPFTTLASKVAKLDRGIFINDTIGFLRDLPHDLIYAFRATFGQIKNSDLIVLMLDASEKLEDLKSEKEVSEAVLKEIEAENIPVLYVLNKLDKLNQSEILEKRSLISDPEVVELSALYGTGVKELKLEIRRLLS